MSDNRIPIRTAILVDGGFYKKRARYYWGEKTPEKRAEELRKYCMSLLYSKYENRSLYRIFYYDCPPLSKKIYHPVLKRTIDLKRTPEYEWQNTFLEELRSKRKFAVRLGELSENTAQYILKPESVKKLINGTITVDMLQENDFAFQAEQKGVDMRIGVDIISMALKQQVQQIIMLQENDFAFQAEQKGVDMRIGVDIISMALKQQVQQIILISGDSDFVPAAKQARREGIDMILAPMGATIKQNLHEHIDGLINKINDPETHEANSTDE